MNMIVQVEEGKLKGVERVSALTGRPYCAFLGIPYAEPPVDDLRFKVNTSIYYIYYYLLIKIRTYSWFSQKESEFVKMRVLIGKSRLFDSFESKIAEWASVKEAGEAMEGCLMMNRDQIHGRKEYKRGNIVGTWTTFRF